MTSKLTNGASNDSFLSTVTTKDDDETVSMGEELISMGEETMIESEIGSVGGIVPSWTQPENYVRGKPPIPPKQNPDDQQPTKEPVKQVVIPKNLEGGKGKDQDTKLHVPILIYLVQQTDLRQILLM